MSATPLPLGDLPSKPSRAVTSVSASDATPFDQLLTQLRGLADSERMKGSYLEQLAKHFLSIEPLWADQLGAVWLWSEWPGREGKPDAGIDLVAEVQGGGLLAVQVKFLREDRKIEKKDLDSFFEAMGRNPFTEGLVIDTTAGDWSVRAEEALKNRTKPVRRVSLAELRHCAIDWSTYTLKAPATAPRRHVRKTLRAHQHAAISAVVNAFVGGASTGAAPVDRGKLIMACGTGKTFTALKFVERWTREQMAGTSTVLFMVPSLALLQQSLAEWSAERDPELRFQAFAVGSDINIGRLKNDDLTSVMLADLGAPATTNGERLATLLEDRESLDGLTVVFSTYQSIQAISKAQRLGAPTFDLVICDEAHRTTGATLSGEDESHFVKIHDNDVVAAGKRLYMTATPRIFSAEVKNTARQRDAELVSMDNAELFGAELYRIGFDEAVRAQLLTDYKVVVLGVSEDQVVEGFQRALSQGGHELQIGDVAKLIGCYNALAKRDAGQLAEGFGTDFEPMRRAVAFAKDIKTSMGIANDFESLVDGHLSNILNDDPTDDLTVQARHVDGTMNATTRSALLDWLKASDVTDALDRPVARVLTNARCLSEGVDVPSLDAVLFLHPRKSQVDVVQAVGRVMRRAEGKRFGYIVLPIAIPAGVEPEDALNDNDRYRVVWQVLQALRAHDERLDIALNQAALTGAPPEQITVIKLDLAPKTRRSDHGIGTATEADERIGSEAGQTSASPVPPALLPSGDADQWKDSVYAKLVAKVGTRLYWDDWAGDISVIASRFVALIRAHLDAPGADRRPFLDFVMALRATVNPDVSDADAVELLAQHLITKPVFEAMFPEGSFAQDNPVSGALEAVLDSFQDNAAFSREREPLDQFYARVTQRIRDLPTVRAKQQLLVTLYDKFFSRAFPALADRMGIVFTPVEVVDYILRSADDMLRARFGKSLSDEGVRVIDPFVGTGTFLTRLLQIGLIKTADLSRKYAQEMFANEVVLLSYYIAAVNIESVYREVCAESGVPPLDGGFQGISLTDTFAIDERDGHLAGGVFPENTARLERQRSTPLNVIVMNPPYRAGQSSANGAGQNAKYSELDRRISSTYIARSTGTQTSKLYDSYYRALRWASDRIGDEGVVAFVSNSGFVDSPVANGVRLTWAEEYSEIIVYDLRGNQRRKNWQAEGGKVFGEGSQTGVAITLLIKSKEHEGPARIHYRDVGDFLTREEKLDRLKIEASVSGTAFETITPNEAGDWINQRDESFAAFQPIGDKSAKARSDSVAVFRYFALGASTNRDPWVCNFSTVQLARNIDRMIAEFDLLLADESRSPDRSLIGWSSKFDARRRAGRPLENRRGVVREILFRPFMRQHVWMDADVIDAPGISKHLAPTPNHSNLAIAVNTDSRIATPPMIADGIVSLHLNGDSQVFPRYSWEPVATADGGFNLEALTGGEGEVLDGFKRVDNITDGTLIAYRKAHGAAVTKDDIFYAIYALLHHPTYREKYAADLTKMLPRIPVVADFAAFATIGRALAELHLHYESAPTHVDLQEEWSVAAPDDEFERYRIEKPSWESRKGRGRLRYNAHLTISGIPEQESLYRVAGRSPLEWVMDRYRVKVDKVSGIRNDPNAWLHERNRPRYVVDLIGSLVTVSLETQRLIEELPTFEVLDGA